MARLVTAEWESWSCSGEKQLNEWGVLRGEQLSPLHDPCPVPGTGAAPPPPGCLNCSFAWAPCCQPWVWHPCARTTSDIAEVSSLSTGTNDLGANTGLPREPYPVLSSILARSDSVTNACCRRHLSRHRAQHALVSTSRRCSPLAREPACINRQPCHDVACRCRREALLCHHGLVLGRPSGRATPRPSPPAPALCSGGQRCCSPASLLCDSGVFGGSGSRR
jgi:hypothetical protein